MMITAQRSIFFKEGKNRFLFTDFHQTPHDAVPAPTPLAFYVPFIVKNSVLIVIILIVNM